MNRFASFLIIAVLAFASAGVAAHAVVTGSSLQRQPVAAHEPTEVVLTFNSSIEIGLSRVMLVAQGGALTPLPIRAGKKTGDLLVRVPALEPGDYALKYRIFAADGHLTEAVLRFTVAP